MICSICGKIIPGNHTKDHIFPREIAKWSSDEAVKACIESKYNRAPAHFQCNYAKQDQLPDLDELYIDDKRKAALRQRIAEIWPHIQAHEDRKQELRASQHDRCYWCGGDLSDIGILRRIDPKGERQWDNACIVCRTCNEKRKHFKK